jgi:hypothetical protein
MIATCKIWMNLAFVQNDIRVLVHFKRKPVNKAEPSKTLLSEKSKRGMFTVHISQVKGTDLLFYVRVYL